MRSVSRRANHERSGSSELCSAAGSHEVRFGIEESRRGLYDREDYDKERSARASEIGIWETAKAPIRRR